MKERGKYLNIEQYSCIARSNNKTDYLSLFSLFVFVVVVVAVVTKNVFCYMDENPRNENGIQGYISIDYRNN